MSLSEQPNREQAERWSAANGPWVKHRALIERMLSPFEAQLTDHVAANGGQRVLDIGCGSGGTTLAVARRLGPQGRCLGADISTSLIAAAKARAAADGLANAGFVEADAQTYAFQPGAFDTVISRFGVMFFEDPAAAFANIRAATTPGARLAVIAWRSAAENPFMTTAARALASLFPPQPLAPPGAPGQFAFADTGRIRDILNQGGWKDAAIAPLDLVCTLSADELMAYVMDMGPVGDALRNADDATRAEARRLLQSAFQPFMDGAVARIPTACWWVTARS